MTIQKLSKNQEIIRFSIVIPTYQRREVVLRSVQALAHQEFEGNFEVIVVVDGSMDGSGEALRQLSVPFPLMVIEQPNQGASTARNRGAQEAKGEIILFLDDDMEAHPQLITEHNGSHQQGADAVIGNIPLHPESPKNFLSYVVGQWAEERVNELLAVNGNLPFNEIMTGQLSISRKTFFEVGGFDIKFTQGGSFGNEDLDFGLRLTRAGYKVLFNPKAISWQKYVVTPRQYLRQYRQAGRADVLFARLHPEEATKMFHRPESLMDRLIWRWFRGLIRGFVLTVLELGSQRSFIVQMFSWLVNLEYYQGVREAGGIPKPRPLRILCYHAIADLAKDPVLQSYGIPPEQFREQMDLLLKSGYRFIDADEFLRFVQGKGGLPKQPILLTFDDCYQDVLDFALPILQERHIPAIAFAVSQRLTNEWDQAIGTLKLPLMDAEGLKKLAQGGIEIGSHSQTHPELTQISEEQLIQEINGSVIDLEKMGLTRPRLFAYPYGDYNHKVQKQVQEIGLEAAFTVEPNFVKPGENPYQIPRFEIFNKDTGFKFRWKVFTAGRSWKKFMFNH
jgi:peptidoglycan/xylan/chitin deacetylase (PgdA/CDA1 family)/glycosyltransferase involved in cell wall biosynthesis